MKGTGIVRRIDDLGRVVILKEIRRRMKIREGEALEIYTTENAVVFRKYRSSVADDIDAVLERISDFDSCESFPWDDVRDLRKALQKVRKWLEGEY